MVRDGDDWLGAAAIEASRLCADAAGGAVLVADATVRLSRGRSNHLLRLVGERTLRGFDVPLEVYELASDKNPRDALPPPLAQAAGAPLVGRASETARARALLGTVVDGGARTSLLVGEPGVGKTRLAAAIAAEAIGRGFTVLHGRCDEGLAAPYQPIVEAFDPWLAECPDAALARTVGPGGPDLVHLWPAVATRLGLAATPAEVDPETRRWRLFEAVVGLVRSAAAERPLLLVVDDLQWAEPSTLQLLAHVVRRTVPATAVVATLRTAEGGTDPATLLGELGSDQAIDIVDLAGLGAAEVGELVAISAGDAPPEELAEQLRRHTDGNPFFLAAVLAHLDDVAYVRTDAGVWVTAAQLDAAGVPAGVRGVIARRLSRLEAGARAALDVAAVTGLTFDERIIRGVLTTRVDETVDALDVATAGGLVREEDAGRYAFTHALVRHAVLDGLSKTRRAHVHWRIAAQMERDHPSRPGEVAFHYASGSDVGDAATIVRTSLAAGDDALQRVAFEEAAEHLRTARTALDRLTGHADLRYRVLSSLGYALNALAEPDEAQRLWLEAADIARETRDPQRLFRAVQGYGYMMRLNADVELMELLDDLLEMLGPEDSEIRASALGWRAAPIQGRTSASPPQADVGMADEAVAMARRTGSTDALISTLHSRLLLEAQAPDVTAMLRDAEELVSTGAHAGPMTWDHTFALRLLTLALLRLGRRAEAERHLADVVEEAEQSGLRMSSHNAQQLQSALATATGRFTEGKRLAAEAAQRAGRHIMLVELGFAAQIHAARMEEGRLDTVIAALRGLDSLEVELPAWRAMLADALADVDRHSEAAEQLSRIHSVRTSDAVDGRIGGAPLAIRHLSEVYRQLGDDRRAATLLRVASPWGGQILVGAWGLSIEGASDRAIGHLMATLGRLDEADAAYTSAADLERAAGFPPLVARTEYWHARALLERDAPGDRARAATLLDGVVEVAGGLGMELLCRQAADHRLR